MNDLTDMADRAQRHLDGMRVSTDRMAKDVLALVATVRALQQQAHEEREPEPMTYSVPAGGKLDDILDEVFGGRT